MLVKKILFGTQYLTSDQIYNNMKEKKKYDAFLQGGGAEKTSSPPKRPASPPSNTMLNLSNDHDNFDGE